MPKQKNPAAVELGRLGGAAAAKSMTAEQRKERAAKGARGRIAKRSQSTPTTTV